MQPGLSDHIKASEAEVRAFAASLERFLRQNVGRITGRLLAAKVDALGAANVLGQLREQLERAGLGAEIARIQAAYQRELDFIARTFKELGIKDVYSGADAKTIEALIQFDVSRVDDRVTEYVGDMRATMMRSIVGGETVDFNDVADKFGGRFESDLNTELNTSLQAFNRSVTVGKATDLGFEQFEYVGPEDGVTRPFCEEVLNPDDRDAPIYTIDEIEAMDNGQGLPVMQYGGGYNCRHGWQPVEGTDAGDVSGDEG